MPFPWLTAVVTGSARPDPTDNGLLAAHFGQVTDLSFSRVPSSGNGKTVLPAPLGCKNDLNVSEVPGPSGQGVPQHQLLVLISQGDWLRSHPEAPGRCPQASGARSGRGALSAGNSPLAPTGHRVFLLRCLAQGAPHADPLSPCTALSGGDSSSGPGGL